MERAIQKASFYTLPEDLLDCLFFKLPVKTLLTCKDVCEQWKAHISNRDFVHRHYAHNMQIRQHLQPFTSMFAFYWDNRKNVTKLVSIHDDNVPTIVEESLRLPQQTRMSNQPIGTVMHCKGVLAVCFLPEYMLLMYNPATRESEIIRRRTPQEDIQVKSVAFGFDHRTESFKYVILTNLAGGTRYFFEVYSRGTEMWLYFEAPVEVTDAYTYWNDGVLYDKIFYWIVPRKQNPQKLLLFDMSSNSVSHLILLDGLQRPEETRKKLMQCNNSLAIIFYARELKSIFSFEVWTLYGSIWTHHATIELGRSFSPVVFWKPTELLFQEEGGRLWLYNLCNRVFRAIPMKSKTELFHATCFFESLVTV